MNTAQDKTWSNNKAEMKRLNAFLKAEGEKHEAELDAGKPLNLKLVKVRRHN